MNFLQRTSANSLDGRDGGAGRWTGHPDGQQPRPAARLPHSRQGRSPRHQIPTPWQVGPQGGQVRLLDILCFLLCIFFCRSGLACFLVFVGQIFTYHHRRILQKYEKFKSQALLIKLP